MKITEIRELTIEELHQKIQESRKELFEARLKHTLQQLENTATLSKLKRQVAKLNTVLREKQSA